MTLQRRIVVVLVLSLSLMGGSGCAAFRAEAGFGLGVGAVMKVPAILHVGLAYMKLAHFGHNYCDGWRAGDTGGLDHHLDKEVALVIFHHSGVVDKWRDVTVYDHEGTPTLFTDPPIVEKTSHNCFGLLPMLSEPDQASSYALEVSVGLIFFDIRLGFNPWYWSQSEHWSRVSIAEKMAREKWSEGVSLDSSQKYEEAIKAYDAAIDLDPTITQAYMAKARNLQELGRLDETLATLDAVIEMLGEDTFAYRPWQVKGAILGAQKRWQEAETAFSKSLAIKPMANCYLGRGAARERVGQDAGALGDVLAALELEPRNGDAYALRSYLMGKNGYKDNALKDYREVLKLNPERAKKLRAALKELGIEVPRAK